jgi:hypothetical protein
VTLERPQTYRDPPPAPPPARVRYWLLGPLARITLSVTVALASLGFFVATGPHRAHSPLVWVMVGLGSTLGVATMVFLFWQNAIVEVDRAERVVRLIRVRRPLRRQVCTFALSRVKDAVVGYNPASDSLAHMIELVVDGQPNVPLLEGIWVNDEKRQRAIAAEIRALLDPERSDPERR